MLVPSVAALALACAASASASASASLSGNAAPRSANACASGAYIIVARGTNEAPGQGKTSQVAQMVADRVPGSISVAVDYPATALRRKKRDLYPVSVTKGIQDTINKIHNYVAACGEGSKIVLMGWSQGGNVMTDTLAGGRSKPDPIGEEYRKYSRFPLYCLPFISSVFSAFLLAFLEYLFVYFELTPPVKAVTVFGDPSFSANRTYDYGSNAHGSMEGIFARRSAGTVALLQTYSDVLASYCDVNDAYCASGDNANTVHGDEVPKHAQEATDFIVARL